MPELPEFHVPEFLKVSDLVANDSLDWDYFYRQGTPSWDTGKPEPCFFDMLKKHNIRSGSVLEIGCGSGADACLMSALKFDVTAIDVASMAVDRAHLLADKYHQKLRIVHGDVFPFSERCGTFDLVYDIGFYHYIRDHQLRTFLDLLWRVTRSGSYYYTLCASAENALPEFELEKTPHDPMPKIAPPPVYEDEIRMELGRLFETIDIQPAFMQSRECIDYPAWSCLFRRP
ncbi:MAG: class I SAM-dependent methyltransferase [Thermoguttaceae bacterium]|jgi:SAM-dependent methyltransferase|nr:class I SAM-dependent methyltransferase [Thermoguttaceae bacterium]MBQ6616819.1 class I SAM-dependent methyltransferase [Thermoguttaceae bacterium]